MELYASADGKRMYFVIWQLWLSVHDECDGLHRDLDICVGSSSSTMASAHALSRVWVRFGVATADANKVERAFCHIASQVPPWMPNSQNDFFRSASVRGRVSWIALPENNPKHIPPRFTTSDPYSRKRSMCKFAERTSSIVHKQKDCARAFK